MSARAVPEPSIESDACRRIDPLLEPYVDGELGDTDRARVRRHTARCARCTGQLALTERVRSDLRALPVEPCPERVSAAALAHARRFGWQRDSSPAPAPAKRWRPALALAAALALAVLGLFLFLRPAPPPQLATAPAAVTAQAAEVDPAEVARAQAEVELALAYLGKIGARTGDIVRHDVLERRVASPVVARVRDALGHDS